MAAQRGDEWTPERSVAGERNPWTIVGIISIATLMLVLDTTIANVALGHIAGNLSTSYEDTTWVVTSFLVANAVVIPISGKLSDLLGRKRYYMLSVALFTFSSLLCGLSPTLGFLIGARILQGLGGGGLAPVEQSMLVDTFPPEKRGRAFSAYGVVVIVGPIFGPLIGGYITDAMSWHWVFLINIPVGILSLFLVWHFVKEPEILERERRERLRNGIRFDFVGAVLVILWLGSLQVALDRGQQDNWFDSTLISAAIAISVLSLVAFIPWELRRRDPVVKISMYARRNFLVANLLMLTLGVFVFGSTQFIPQLLQQVEGYSAFDAGQAMTLGGIAALFSIPVAGYLSDRVDPRYLLAIAFSSQVIAFWYMAQLNTQMSFEDAALARMIQTVGLPFLFVPISQAAYIGLAPDESNQASALVNVARNLGGSMGISLVQTILAQREQFHQWRFTEILNPLNPAYVHWLERITKGLMSRGIPSAQAEQTGHALIYSEMQRQVAMLSYIDLFHILMIMAVCAVPVVFLMRRP